MLVLQVVEELQRQSIYGQLCTGTSQQIRERRLLRQCLGISCGHFREVIRALLGTDEITLACPADLSPAL
jgi:hypothetical protein